ncbi:glycoprotein 3-alpha-L-fucosyltransferase A-like isoform X2 [Plodia interpunctella]|uniref:glycoprotein 3-alpha-L-fucosyltransferase A-like isoform X2 n=1 Tax=Plodia interpunctella TaxID=58824 RepID=UPI002367BDE0|nr:glycoprotein 3-alpha-L-fucosyltransferase A-like isoform X2 [Plodia interpunctella]
MLTKRFLESLKHLYSVIRKNLFKCVLRRTSVNGRVFCSLLLISVVIYYFSVEKKLLNFDGKKILKMSNLSDHMSIVSQYYEMRKSWKTSKLGSLLFKNETFDLHKQNKTFIILVWKYWNWLRQRHGRLMNQSKDKATLLSCDVKNCVFTGNDSLIDSVDVVLVHIMREVYPEVQNRSINQKWIFLNDESPQHAFISNADVPVPYGRTVALDVPVKENVTYESIAELIPNFQYKRSDVLVAVAMSNCHVPFRMKFLEEMQKYIKIDIYGKCSPNRLWCNDSCKDINQYYFYLVMENSRCRQYLSEKVFHFAYGKGAIPIILGAPPRDCKTLLPPNSYLHAKLFSHKDLADKIISIIHNENDFFSYHLWRNHFEVLNEHGYFGSKSYHLCRLCEALNYNDDKRKIYKLDDMRHMLDSKALCRLK